MRRSWTGDTASPKLFARAVQQSTRCGLSWIRSPTMSAKPRASFRIEQQAGKSAGFVKPKWVASAASDFIGFALLPTFRIRQPRDAAIDLGHLRLQRRVRILPEAHELEIVRQRALAVAFRFVKFAQSL